MQSPAQPTALTSAQVSPAAVSTAPATTNPITAVLTGVVNWITGLTQATNSPVPPPQAPTLWAILGWVRREIQYTLFNSSPTINYNQTLTSQTLNTQNPESVVPVHRRGRQLRSHR
jgi:hypothetical protein